MINIKITFIQYPCRMICVESMSENDVKVTKEKLKRTSTSIAIVTSKKNG